MKYNKRLTQITVVPEGNPIFSELATVITIEDDAAGEYISISQHADESTDQTIKVEPEEWQAIKEAVDRLFFEISAHSPSPTEPESNLPQKHH
jgi:hypothetical protein